MATMQRLQFDQVSTSVATAADVFHLDIVPKPKVQHPTEVLVRVKATCLHPGDKLHIAGISIHFPVFPAATAGFEGAGIIEEVGSEVKDFKAGDRVFFLQVYSTWAEYVVIDTQPKGFGYLIQHLPNSISFEKGAQLIVNPFTVFSAFEELKVQKGDFLLITAAGSSCGRAAIRIGKAKGIKTIAVVRRDTLVDELKSFGADYVINSEKENLAERIAQITGGQGVRHAFDCVGGALTNSLATGILTPGGVIVLYGAMDQSPIGVSAKDLFLRNITLRGFNFGFWLVSNPAKFPELFKELVVLVENNTLPLSFKTFEFAQFKEAFAHSNQPGKHEQTLFVA